jgi:hypothetical protein
LPHPDVDDQQQNLIAQMGLGYACQGPTSFNLPSLIEIGARLPVLCPMGMLPAGPCPWRGEKRLRMAHVSTNHMNYLVPSNYIKMPSNYIAILNAYAEYFVCYTVAESGNLHCIVQHACSAYNCLLTYQYRCEIYAENRYEKISITRLVGHLKDDFHTMSQSGRCVILDNAVVNCFASNDGLYIHITVLVPEAF